jgi:hypothetical protein
MNGDTAVKIFYGSKDGDHSRHNEVPRFHGNEDMPKHGCAAQLSTSFRGVFLLWLLHSIAAKMLGLGWEPPTEEVS